LFDISSTCGFAISGTCCVDTNKKYIIQPCDEQVENLQIKLSRICKLELSVSISVVFFVPEHDPKQVSQTTNPKQHAAPNTQM